MKLDFLFKWINSGGGGCPAFYRTDQGSFVVQGYTLDADALGQLRQPAANETAVEIPGEMYGQIGEAWARENGLLP